MDDNLVHQPAFTVLDVRFEKHFLLGYHPDGNRLSLKKFFKVFPCFVYGRYRRSCAVPSPTGSLAVSSIWPPRPPLSPGPAMADAEKPAIMIIASKNAISFALYFMVVHQ